MPIRDRRGTQPGEQQQAGLLHELRQAGSSGQPWHRQSTAPDPGTVPQHLSRVGRAGPIAATGSVNCLLTISQIQGLIPGTRTIQKSQQRGQDQQGAMLNTGYLQHSSEQDWVHESELRWGSWAAIKGCGWMS